MALAIDTKAAERLAYYVTEDSLRVLGPLGWHCFETYGSNGSTLYVSPSPLTFENLTSTSWAGFTGPAIEYSNIFSGTSGRFSVARTIARVFPAHKSFVENVIAEGLAPASDFPLGPYPRDKLTYHGDDLVEFETPANAAGLGTQSKLSKNDSPISGMAMLVGKEFDLAQLAVRLPGNQVGLTPMIVQQAERDAARARQ